ncbi:hypothetical protein M2323_000352 [Rhodoblastus acidophilus]|uniref:ATP-binding protein n=1 Tax=Rhodoblastus acidophilus TaxID=1074 RepID=UPI002225549F|nr:ATP-binding protein [Rhodoblastus acidophilus]MCW2282591.1 hypothetical protein [Rhodoblastus acidophilus]MCW2331452.1 hypothetical protein [Rhodoblastus acidophilus]
MTVNPPHIPSRELIENGTIREDRFYEFKHRDALDDSDKKKSDIVDDVIGFLNAERVGHIVFGIRDKRGAFGEWVGFSDDQDKTKRKIISFLHDLIDPKPTGLAIGFIELDGGEYAIDLRIAQHRFQPYQNRRTGGFKIRMDAENAVIKRDDIYAQFKKIEDFKADLVKRCLEEDRAVAEANDMADEGAILTISILPRDHYENLPPLCVGDRHVMRLSGRDYHYHRQIWFKGCGNGQEAVSIDGNSKVITRLMVADDWFIHATVAHPIQCDEERGRSFSALKEMLHDFLSGIEELAKASNVRGPFLHRAEFTNLGRGRIKGAFHRHAPLVVMGGLVEQITDEGFVDRVYEKALSVSIYR